MQSTALHSNLHPQLSKHAQIYCHLYKLTYTNVKFIAKYESFMNTFVVNSRLMQCVRAT